jgi:ATP-dependent metalloprotease
VRGFGNRLGIVVAAYDSHEVRSRDNTRRDYDHMIRVALAGRAAECIVLGSDAVSATGSSQDLEHATNMAMAMLGSWGLPMRSGDMSVAGSNLAVVGEDDKRVGREHTMKIVRTYLSEQFDAVCTLLNGHRELLDRIAAELGARVVLFEDDFHRLLQGARGTARCAAGG